MLRTWLCAAVAAGSTLAGAGAFAQDEGAPAQPPGQRRFEALRELRGQMNARGGPAFPNFQGQFAPGQENPFLAFAFNEADDPALGATLVPVSDRLRAQLRIPEGRGLVAQVVDPNGPAAQSGLKTNDILLSLGEDPLAKPEDLGALLKEAKDDATLELKIMRGGKPVTLKVKRVVTVTCGPAESQEPSDYVLGVAVSVPDDALRAHLELPDDRGLLVDQVVKGSPAEKGGIKQNDVLLSIAGKALDGTEALIAQVRENKDKPTELRLLREGKELTLVVTPEKRAMKERLARVREPMRMWMFDPSNQGVARVPGVPPMNVPGMRMQPFNAPVPNARVEQFEGELKALRESIEELKEALKSGRKDRD